MFHGDRRYKDVRQSGLRTLAKRVQDSPGFRGLGKAGGPKGQLELLTRLRPFAELRQDGTQVVANLGIPSIALGGRGDQLLRSGDVTLEEQEPPERVRRTRARWSHSVGAFGEPDGLGARAR